jgi:hypothetical protein
MRIFTQTPTTAKARLFLLISPPTMARNNRIEHCHLSLLPQNLLFGHSEFAFHDEDTKSFCAPDSLYACEF